MRRKVRLFAWGSMLKFESYQTEGFYDEMFRKPTLDRTLTHQDSTRFALKVGCLAFDSTRISAADVDFPIDVILYARDSFQFIERRYAKDDLLQRSSWWQERLRRSVAELPSHGIDSVFADLVAVTNPHGTLHGTLPA